MTSPDFAAGLPRCTRRLVTLLLALLTLGIAAMPASATTADQIVRDVRDGHVDGVYRSADLEAALASPLLKTYGGKHGVEAVKQALGTQTAGSAGSGQLPFTGFELATFVVLGATLSVAGFILRRQRPDSIDADR